MLSVWLIRIEFYSTVEVIMLSVEVFCSFNEGMFSRIIAEMSSSPCVNMLLDNVAQLLMCSLHRSYEYYCEHSILVF
jgi:hypothetical protein